MSSYSYTATSGFATEGKIAILNGEIDSRIGNRVSTRIEGDCITFTFVNTLSEDSISILNSISQVLTDTKKPKKTSFDVYPRIDSVSSTDYVLLGRTSYKMIHSEQTLDYIDVMVKMDVGAVGYSIQVVDSTTKTTIATLSGNNVDFQTIDMGSVINTSNTILEIYAKVDNVGGSVYVDQLQFYYN